MMPEEITLEFGEWLPDIPAIRNPGITVAKNVIPDAVGYRQQRSLSAFSNALTSACLGAVWVQDSGGTIHNFAADSAALYKLSGGDTWSAVTRTVGGAYSATGWEFALFGDRLIATNINDVMQYYDLGVSSNFAALSGSPPQAAHIGVIGDFLVAGNLIEGANDYPNRVRWGGFNATELWGTNPSTQADFQDLYGKGTKIQKVVGGQSIGVLVLEDGLRRMPYEGPPRVFGLYEVEGGRGTPAPDSVVSMGGRIYYLAQDGFWSLDAAGGSPTPIGAGKVNKWFLSNVAGSELENVRGAVDRQNGLVMWAFKSSSGSVANDRLLVFSYLFNKWAWSEIDTQIIGEQVSSGYSLDDLAAILTDIDAESIPMETTAYKGGGLPSLMAFNGSNQAATFAGAALSAQLETMEVGGSRRANINCLRPYISGTPTSMTAQIGGRDKINESVVYQSSVTENELGEFSVNSRKRYARARVTINGGFEQAFGMTALGRRGSRK